MAKVPPSRSLDQFWKWLKSRREAPTLGQRSRVFGQVQGDSLILMSSEVKEYSVSRETAEAYCREAARKKFHGLVANKRWVAALHRNFLDA